jgi:hypothetical protein
MTDLPVTGGYNCGAVRFEVTEPLVAASYCHCKRCQPRSGAAASPNAHRTRIVAREETLRMWKPQDGGEKWFCGECGSSPCLNPRHADPIGIRMGTFDGDLGIRRASASSLPMPLHGRPSPTTDYPITPKVARAETAALTSTAPVSPHSVLCGDAIWAQRLGLQPAGEDRLAGPPTGSGRVLRSALSLPRR